MSVHLPQLSDIEKILSTSDWNSKSNVPSRSPRVCLKRPILKKSSFTNTSNQDQKLNIPTLANGSPQVLKKIQLFKAYHLNRSLFNSPKRSSSPQVSLNPSQVNSRMPSTREIPTKINLAVPFQVLNKALKKHIDQNSNKKKSLLIPAVPKLPYGIHREAKFLNFEKIEGCRMEDVRLKRKISRIKKISGRKKYKLVSSNRNSPRTTRENTTVKRYLFS